VIHHVVAMKFADPADAAEAKLRLEELSGTVPEIGGLRVDLDNLGSPTGHHLLLTTTHDSEADLRGYQQHPAHVHVATWLKERLADRAVVDWAD
jgi:hypothetical protein